MILWSFPKYPDDYCWSSFVESPSRDCFCLVCKRPLPSSCNSCRQFVQMHHLCPNMTDIPTGCIHVWVIHIIPGQFWARRSWILSILGTSCFSSTFWTSNGGSGGVGRTGQFSPSLFRAGTGSSFWKQFGCVSVAPNGAGFGPCLNFWGADTGPVSVMVRLITGRVVSFSWEGMASKSEKVNPTKGMPAKGMSCRKDTGRGEVSRGGVRPPEGPEASEQWGSGSGSGWGSGSASDAVGWGSDIVGMPSTLSSSNGHHSTYMVERHHCRDAPGQ